MPVRGAAADGARHGEAGRDPTAGAGDPHVRPKYACHHCEGSGDEQHPAVRVAPAPPALIPKGLASEGLLASHRQVLRRAAAVPAGAAVRGARGGTVTALDVGLDDRGCWRLCPADGSVERQTARRRNLQLGETTVQVLKEPGRANTTISYLWVARGGPPSEPVLVYRYEPSRGGHVTAAIIGEYQGYVQTDGYEAYDRPCSQPGIRHLGCWSHVRRPFKEAADALGKVSRRAGAALQALSFIAKLYRAESELSKYRAADPDRFVAERRTRVEPVLEQLHRWLQQKHGQVRPGSALGKAVAFALGQWPKLIRYLEHAQSDPGQQRLRAGDPAVRGGAQELAVLRKSPRRGRERDPVQSDRDRQGQRPRAVLVSTRAVRAVCPMPAPVSTTSRSWVRTPKAAANH